MTKPESFRGDVLHLIIIGTVHLDPAGPELLKRSLELFKPEFVTIDVSRYAIDFRQSKSAKFQAQLAPFRRHDGTLPVSLAAVEAQISLPFEVCAVDAWGGKYDLVGNDNDSKNRLELFENELMSPENLLHLAENSAPTLITQANRQWEKARRNYRTLSEIKPCDEQIAILLRQLLPQYGNTICHVTGWEHLAPLESLLADLKPKLYLLDEFRQ